MLLFYILIPFINNHKQSDISPIIGAIYIGAIAEPYSGLKKRVKLPTTYPIPANTIRMPNIHGKYTDLYNRYPRNKQCTPKKIRPKS